MWLARECEICKRKEITFRTPYDGWFNKAPWTKLETDNAARD